MFPPNRAAPMSVGGTRRRHVRSDLVWSVVSHRIGTRASEERRARQRYRVASWQGQSGGAAGHVAEAPRRLPAWDTEARKSSFYYYYYSRRDGKLWSVHSRRKRSASCLICRRCTTNG